MRSFSEGKIKKQVNIGNVVRLTNYKFKTFRYYKIVSIDRSQNKTISSHHCQEAVRTIRIPLI